MKARSEGCEERQETAACCRHTERPAWPAGCAVDCRQPPSRGRARGLPGTRLCGGHTSTRTADISASREGGKTKTVYLCGIYFPSNRACKDLQYSTRFIRWLFSSLEATCMCVEDREREYKRRCACVCV